LTKPSVRPAEEAIDVAKPDLMVIDEPDQGLAYDWMSPIKMCLDNNAEVERITHKSMMYHLIDGILYR
jgi:Fe-S cluster assembly ATPase SufC